jgi:hypothetical protein
MGPLYCEVDGCKNIWTQVDRRCQLHSNTSTKSSSLFCVEPGCNRDRVPGSEQCVVHANIKGVTNATPIRHPNSSRFHAILKELGDLHDKKQADYGRGDDPFANVRASTEWGVPSWVGAMVRLNDKVRRLQTFSQRGTLSNEGVEDSLRDIAVYATIALVLFEQEGKR